MDSLLKNNFTSFHQLPISNLNIRQDTILPYFELEDIDIVLTLSVLKIQEQQNTSILII